MKNKTSRETYNERILRLRKTVRNLKEKQQGKK